MHVHPIPNWEQISQSKWKRWGQEQPDDAPLVPRPAGLWGVYKPSQIVGGRGGTWLDGTGGSIKLIEYWTISAATLNLVA